MNTVNETAAVAFIMPEALIKEAARTFADAEKAEVIKTGARTRMVGILAKAQPLELHFYLKNAKGEVLVDEYATISDLLDASLFNEICGEGRKHKAFVLNTIASKLSGIDVNKVTSAMRDCLETAMPVAFHVLQRIDGVLEQRFANAKNEQEREEIALLKPEDLIEVKAKGITLPFEAAVNHPGDKASESEKEDYETRVGSPVTFDGGTKLRTFSALARNVTPKKERAPQQTSNGDSPFLAALKSMAKGNPERECLAAWFASLSTTEIFQIIREAAANSEDRAIEF